jgi:hypothetical protein
MSRRGLGVALCVVALTSVVGGAPGAQAKPAKTIHPGVSVHYGDVTCAVAAVMKQHKRLFLAVPASCGGIDLGKPTDGCSSPQAPIGLPVSIQGAKHRGRLVYSSFAQMQLNGDTNPNRCYYNDLALVQVARKDRARVSAAIPKVGVPTGVVAKLPGKGTALRIGGSTGSAADRHHNGWVLDLTSSPTAMFRTPDCGVPVTTGRRLVGMLLILPKGPIPMVPLFQSPAQTYNLARAVKYLKRTPGFRHVHIAD